MQFEETQTQDEIDSKIKEFEERSRGAFAAQVVTPSISGLQALICRMQAKCMRLRPQ